MSQLVADTFEEEEDDSDDDEDNAKTVPLPNVSSEILEKIVAYGKHYQEETMTPIQTPLKSARLEDLVQPWYVDFVNVDEKTLFSLVSASNFMDIKPLLDLTCLAVSIVIKVRLLPTVVGYCGLGLVFAKESGSFGNGSNALFLISSRLTCTGKISH